MYCSAGACLASPPPPPDGGVAIDCPAPRLLCKDPSGYGAVCTDGKYDPMNCGGCGHVCPAGSVCNVGYCQPGGTAPACMAPMMGCPGPQGMYCTDPLRDAINCGACGSVCPGGYFCGNGMCQPGGAMSCAAPMITCPDATGAKFCTDMYRDSRNCGGCGIACGPDHFCAEGKCQLGAATACPAPKMMCPDGMGVSYCSDVYSDPRNCGRCGMVCAAGSYCTNGSLPGGSPPPPQCPAGMSTCGPAAGPQYCADLIHDRYNCGGCGVVCSADQYCDQSRCQVGAAPADGGAPPRPAPSRW